MQEQKKSAINLAQQQRQLDLKLVKSSYWECKDMSTNPSKHSAMENWIFFRLQIIPTCDQHVNKFSKDQPFQVDKWFYLSPVTFASAKNLHSFVCGLLRRIWIGIDIDKQSLLLIRLLRSLCKWILPIYLNWLKSTAYLTSEGDYIASEFW